MVFLTTPLPPAPSAPSGLITTTLTTSAIGLQWTDNSGNEDGFKVERSADGVNYAQRSTLNANTVTCTDTGLSANTTYLYRVYAYNLGGNSGYSNVISGTTLATPPTVPSNLITTTVTSSSIGLQWQDNSTDEASFKIERSTDGVTYTLRSTLSANTISYTDTALSSNTTYWYRVYASNSGGDSGYSNVISATTLAPPPPNAPSGLNATVNTISSTNLIWVDNSGDETSFKIECSTDGLTYSQVATVTANTTSYINTGLSLGITYYYRVKSSNTNGDSAYSNVATITISVQPDSSIKLSGESDIAYIGDNIYNTDALSQTKNANVTNQTASYYIRLQNDGSTTDLFRITGSAGNADWVVSYYDVPTNTNITSLVTGSGYIISALNPTLYATLRLEVTPITTTLGAFIDTFVTATSTNDPSKKDTVKARTEIPTAVDDYVWVASIYGNVTRILKSDITQKTTIAVGTYYSYGVAVDETYVWVANWIGGSGNTITRILKFDLTKTTITVGSNPQGVAVDGTYVWVANSGSNNVTRINKLDLTTSMIVAGSSPGGIAVDENYCWVANYGSNNVTRILKSDLSTATIVVSTQPWGIAVDGTYCWVSSNNSWNVTRILKSDITQKTTIALGTGAKGANGVAVDATYVWVANYASSTVTRILKSDLSATTIGIGGNPWSLGDMTGYAYDNYSNAPLSVYKPDAQIKSVESVAYIGDNIYNLDAISQTA
ncbi:MAG: fibronectin type III domain-containing protein, partial [Planctomycetota bacterium]|nr:fibronectin type III domain-containing protein [Planctomycetota bacterium]